MIALVAAIVALIGLLLYALVANAKIAEIGRIMFACGLLVTLYVIGGRNVKLL